MAKVLLLLITFYRRGVSPYFKPRCRFVPTCSQYASESLAVHGAFLGVLLAFWRILRCNPFGRGGFDPVPPKHFYKMGLW